MTTVFGPSAINKGKFT
ncbi:hypothetical protein GQ600_24884 [Phytophthora cactorum]|nr:hypothetical protein GQ600_24884 [Phytophthora cactorum]